MPSCLSDRGGIGKGNPDGEGAPRKTIGHLKRAHTPQGEFTLGVP